MINKQAKDLKRGDRFLRDGRFCVVIDRGSMNIEYHPSVTKDHVAFVDDTNVLHFIHPDNSVEVEDEPTTVARIIWQAMGDMRDAIVDMLPSKMWVQVAATLEKMLEQAEKKYRWQKADAKIALDDLTIMCLRASKYPLIEPRLLVTFYDGEIQNIQVINGLSKNEIQANAMEAMKQEVKRIVEDELGYVHEDIEGEIKYNKDSDQYHWLGDQAAVNEEDAYEIEDFEVTLLWADEGEMAIDNSKVP